MAIRKKTTTKATASISPKATSSCRLLDWNFFKILPTISLVLIFLTLLSGTILSIIFIKKFDEANKTDKNTLYNTEEYNIVFLNNNLFYFCKLSDFNEEYIACNNPYYLVRKTETDPETGKNTERVFVKKPQEEEIYSPEGAIYLKKDNIVYIAKVGEDSPVFEYIGKDEE